MRTIKKVSTTKLKAELINMLIRFEDGGSDALYFGSLSDIEVDGVEVEVGEIVRELARRATLSK